MHRGACNRAASDGGEGWRWVGVRLWGCRAQLPCEGRGEGEGLCIWDQAVWMATGRQGTEGAGSVRREDGAVGGCGCV